MKTLLTVDFDFFCKEKPEWDFGHQESLIFLKMIWGTRIQYRDQMKTDGNEVGFWKSVLNSPAKFSSPWVSDSHCYAFSLLKGISRVVLVDAHHDCWHDDSLGADKRAKGIYCHNWLREWLRGSKRREAVWVRPGWQESDAYPIPDDLRSRVDVVTWRNGLELGLEGDVAVHVCRSGCWVPPWLDKAFLGFLEAFPGGLGVARPLQDGEWNPLKERWTPEDWKEVLKIEAELRDFVAKNANIGRQSASRRNVSSGGYAVGSISSGSFVNAKVQQSVGVQ